MNNHNGINRLYTAEQVADKLQVNSATIRKYCREGTIKAKKSLKMWLIAEEDLQAYINSLN